MKDTFSLQIHRRCRRVLRHLRTLFRSRFFLSSRARARAYLSRATCHAVRAEVTFDVQMEKSHVLLRRKTSALNKSKIQGLETQSRSQGHARTGGPSEMLSIVDPYPGLFRTLISICSFPHSIQLVQNRSPKLARFLGWGLLFLESFIPRSTSTLPMSGHT